MPVSNNLPTSYVDVLVVGAGPAGLLCGVALAQAGINVKIVDQRPASIPAGQADGIHPRTIEVLQSYGLVERLLKEGNHLHMFAFYNLSKDRNGIERTSRVSMVNQVVARYPFSISLNQGGIERLLLDGLLKEGVIVDRPTRPSSIILSDDERELNDTSKYPITVVLDHLEGEAVQQEIVHAKFLVGSDGAHSWVRRALNIQMEGEQTNHVWGVIDFTPTQESNFPDWRNVCSISGSDTTVLLIPREEGKIRLYIDLGLETGLVDTESGRVNPKSLDSDKLLAIAKPAFAQYTLEAADIDWWTCYVIGQRVATQFSLHERAFVAGDACHTHSPKAGEFTSDLVYTLRGWSGLSLLHTYELERRKFAQELIAFDRWYSAGFSAKARTGTLSNGKKAPSSGFEAFREYNGLTSGVGIQYDTSLITSSGSNKTKIIVGQRFPPQVVLHAADMIPVEIHDLCTSNTRFKIFIFTGNLHSEVRSQNLEVLAERLKGKDGVLCRFDEEIFDVIPVLQGKKETVDYLAVPRTLRSSWDKVLVDETDVSGSLGGRAYETYGIGEDGAIVIVRPDGYVGLVTGIDEADNIGEYFGGVLAGKL
ncbi:uncharacterized protein STEHIDRAFT_49341 [Stereum hirsutum FP-91666 SS1]|uniref:uncharacterized protein n=1 Tax=Stereum hirsutum (strain FP-91666) TaxID=721885 RepID=UPI000440CE01|nr:uncharacterized protein STEHIDRAFT_49341 [Stereum hirsutum FP-91666 SS1]EIM90606.1 hypothetical protein STEHIDRAFT_49341 [Stereum hirsutum FP-91666 SS1]